MDGVWLQHVVGLMTSRVFLAAFCSWFSAQFIKMLVDRLRGSARGRGAVVRTLLWRTGGMPSSHSALVTSLATSVGFTNGTDSPVFVVALFYAVLVIRDALGVRRSAGLQAQALNHLGRTLAEQGLIEFTPVREVVGHSPREVAVGATLGITIGLVAGLV